MQSMSSEQTNPKDMRSEDNISEDIYLSDNVVDRSQFKNSRVEDLMLREVPSQQEIEESFQKNLEYRGLEGGYREGEEGGQSEESSEEEAGDLDMRYMGGKGVFATISEKTEEGGLSELGNDESEKLLFIGRMKAHKKAGGDRGGTKSIGNRKDSRNRSEHESHEEKSKNRYNTDDNPGKLDIGPLGRVQLVHIMKENIKNVEIIQATSFQDSSGQLTVGQNSKVKDEDIHQNEDAGKGEIRWSEDEDMKQEGGDLVSSSERIQTGEFPQIDEENSDQQNTHSRKFFKESPESLKVGSNVFKERTSEERESERDEENPESIGEGDQIKETKITKKDQRPKGSKKEMRLGLVKKIRAEERKKRQSKEDLEEEGVKRSSTLYLTLKLDDELSVSRKESTSVAKQEKTRKERMTSLEDLGKQSQDQNKSQNKELPILEVKSLRSERSGERITVVEPIKEIHIPERRMVVVSNKSEQIYSDKDEIDSDFENENERSDKKIKTIKSEGNLLKQEQTKIKDDREEEIQIEIQIQDMENENSVPTNSENLENNPQNYADLREQNCMKKYQTCPKLNPFKEEFEEIEASEVYYRTETEKDKGLQVGFNMRASDTEKFTHPFSEMTSQLDTIMSKMNSDLNEFSRIGEMAIRTGSLIGTGVKGEILLSKVSEGGNMGGMRRGRIGKFEVTEELDLEVLKEEGDGLTDREGDWKGEVEGKASMGGKKSIKRDFSQSETFSKDIGDKREDLPKLKINDFGDSKGINTETKSSNPENKAVVVPVEKLDTEEDILSISDKIRKIDFEIDHVESSLIRNESLEINESHLSKNRFRSAPVKNDLQSDEMQNVLINAFNFSTQIKNFKDQNLSNEIKGQDNFEPKNRAKKIGLNLILENSPDNNTENENLEKSEDNSANSKERKKTKMKDQHTQMSAVFEGQDARNILENLISPTGLTKPVFSNEDLTVSENDSSKEISQNNEDKYITPVIKPNESLQNSEPNQKLTISPPKYSYSRKKKTTKKESRDFTIEFCNINPNLERFYTDDPKPVSPQNTNSVTELFKSQPRSIPSYGRVSPIQNISRDMSSERDTIGDQEMGRGEERVPRRAEIIGEYLGYDESQTFAESLLKAKSLKEYTDFSNSGKLDLEGIGANVGKQQGVGIGDLIHLVMDKSNENSQTDNPYDFDENDGGVIQHNQE